MKDRLAALKAAQGEDEDEFEADSYGVTMEPRDAVMDEFYKETEELRKLLDIIQEDGERIRKVQSTILSVPTTDKKMQQEMEDLMAAIKSTSSKIPPKLKAIQQSIPQDGEEAGWELDSMSPANIRIRKTQHATLSRRFVDLMTEYNRSQTDYRESCKKMMQRQFENAGKQVGDDEMENMLDKGDVAQLTQGIVTDTQQARQTLQDIETRHADIVKLESSIMELHDMFVDMAVLVESQGDLIDRIEFQVDEAVEYVDRANADMKTANAYQRKARKKKLMILVCLVITGFVLVSTAAGYLGII